MTEHCVYFKVGEKKIKGAVFLTEIPRVGDQVFVRDDGNVYEVKAVRWCFADWLQKYHRVTVQLEVLHPYQEPELSRK